VTVSQSVIERCIAWTLPFSALMFSLSYCQVRAEYRSGVCPSGLPSDGRFFYGRDTLRLLPQHFASFTEICISHEFWH
jgi:hypothetical protein